MKEELKAAIAGLENNGLDHTELWYKLVGNLIDIFEMDDNLEAVRFWNNR